MQRTELEILDGPGGWVQADVTRDDEFFESVWVRLSQVADDVWAPEGALYRPGISPESLRTIPLRRILASVAANPPLRSDLRKRLDEVVPEVGSNEFLKAFTGFVHPEPPLLDLRRPSGRRLTDDFYAAVAETYRTAMTRGWNPRVAIAEAAGTSTDVAGRWVREARKRGQLPPTTPGKVSA